MTRQILFQLHWFLGIVLGIFMVAMGVSGAAFSFNEEIMQALSPGIVTLPVQDRTRLSPDELMARGESQRGTERLVLLELNSDPRINPRATFEFAPGDPDYGISYLNPYTGQLLGPARSMRAFIAVSSFHQALQLSGSEGPGRVITGATGLALIYFAISGLYLRWPRRAFDWRHWFALDLRMTGRNFHRALHAVVGAWVAVFYLVMALTGLYYSYNWFLAGSHYVLTGRGPEPEIVTKYGTLEVGNHLPDLPGKVSLNKALEVFRRETGDQIYDRVTLTRALQGSEVGFFAREMGARHVTQGDYLSVDGTSGRILRPLNRYATRPTGEKILIGMYDLHRGSYFGMFGRVTFFLTSLAMPVFMITGFLLYFARRRKKKELAVAAQEFSQQAVAAADSSGGEVTVVAYASQTGGAERLARHTAAALPGARLRRLAQLDPAELARADRALFIVSTYGDGEPPDEVRRFARRAMASPASLQTLNYSVLALGDREYPDFCAFGHRVDRWLCERGAKRLFDVVECDGEDLNAQRVWRHRLESLGGRWEQPERDEQTYQSWRLAERRLLNPGSAGESAFQIALEPESGVTPRWLPGDVVQIKPRHDPRRVDAFLKAIGSAVDDSLFAKLTGSVLPAPAELRGVDRREWAAKLLPLEHRDYSIASLAESGRIELLVRQSRAENGLFGVGSGWLTAIADIGGRIDVHIRSNAGFHSPQDPTVPLILIGNGTGLAGLLAHLRQRATKGGAPAWLLFGERNAAHDAFHDDELAGYLRSGVLQHLDRAWSRDAECGRYVQELVKDAKPEIQRWIAQGATILVCGSLKGMATSVHAALHEALGEDTLESLMSDGRYRRDVY